MFSEARPPSTLIARPAGADAGDVQLLVGRLIAERLERGDAAESAARDRAGEQCAEEEVSASDAHGDSVVESNPAQIGAPESEIELNFHPNAKLLVFALATLFGFRAWSSDSGY